MSEVAEVEEGHEAPQDHEPVVPKNKCQEERALARKCRDELLAQHEKEPSIGFEGLTGKDLKRRCDKLGDSASDCNVQSMMSKHLETSDLPMDENISITNYAGEQQKVPERSRQQSQEGNESIIAHPYFLPIVVVIVMILARFKRSYKTTSTATTKETPKIDKKKD
jgi:hypothetical protein